MSIIFNKSLSILRNPPKFPKVGDPLRLVTTEALIEEYGTLDNAISSLTEIAKAHGTNYVFDHTSITFVGIHGGEELSLPAGTLKTLMRHKYSIGLYTIEGKRVYLNFMLFEPFFKNPELFDEWIKQ